MIVTGHKKPATPFYMRSRLQNKPMLPIKGIMSLYLYKPEAKTPTAQKLNEKLTSLYRVTRSAQKARRAAKEAKSKSRNATALPAKGSRQKPQKLAELYMKEDPVAERQTRYEKLFCVSAWDKSNWSLLEVPSKDKKPPVKRAEPQLRVKSASKHTRFKNEFERIESDYKKTVAKRLSKSVQGDNRRRLYTSTNNYPFTWYGSKLQISVQKLRFKLFN
eukprot:TRINITY_DN12617_c0_g2_i1.p1 TRINITY_DN12617_c0_g2~~TRINITY_DN12617_c0_g2_i1.p1  ORF type:complete len:218 (+),score=57.53 TRINITY_DN12617_c0_g2_i1:97-750(+)